MISSDVIRGYNDTIILSILMAGDSYGYEISKRIKTATDDAYIIKETTLYSAFNRLEKKGFITAYAGDTTRGRPRTYYRISEAGRAYYLEKCDEWRTTKKVVEAFIREEN